MYFSATHEIIRYFGFDFISLPHHPWSQHNELRTDSVRRFDSHKVALSSLYQNEKGEGRLRTAEPSLRDSRRDTSRQRRQP